MSKGEGCHVSTSRSRVRVWLGSGQGFGWGEGLGWVGLGGRRGADLMRRPSTVKDGARGRPLCFVAT